MSEKVPEVQELTTVVEQSPLVGCVVGGTYGTEVTVVPVTSSTTGSGVRSDRSTRMVVSLGAVTGSKEITSTVPSVLVTRAVKSSMRVIVGCLLAVTSTGFSG